MAPCESISAPLAAAVLTRGSFMGQCQLLNQRCVTHCVQCIASLESVAQCLPKQVSLSNYLGVGFCSAPNISGCTAVFCYLHGDITGCAALRKSITKALAAYVASPFLIEGM